MNSMDADIIITPRLTDTMTVDLFCNSLDSCVAGTVGDRVQD